MIKSPAVAILLFVKGISCSLCFGRVARQAAARCQWNAPYVTAEHSDRQRLIQAVALFFIREKYR